MRKSARIATLMMAALCFTLSVNPQRAPAHQAPPPEVRVDINHASTEQLLKIPGMTQTLAARIVRFRPYRSKNELLEHGVVTGDVYVRIKEYVIAHRD